MTFRIQPEELEIPQEEPFKLDLLEREETVKILTHISRSISGPCVLALDAPWGGGKTTFLRFWAQYLRNNDFSIVEFNAWETDFAEYPFIALTAELTHHIQKYADDNLPGEEIEQMKKAAQVIIRHIGFNAVRGITGGIFDPETLSRAINGQNKENHIDKKLAEYEDTKNAIRDFKKKLQKIAATLFVSKANRPLMIFIDELDRCRPSYAVELLEVAKHLFSVNHIIFVLSLNRFELSQAVRGVYGPGFDAEGYLCRFFDVDVHLPTHSRDQFIDRLLDSQPVDYSKFSNYEGRLTKDGSLRNVLIKFFGTSDLSLRDVEQAVQRLCLVLGSLPDNKPSFTDMTVVLLILRTLKAALYRRFIRGEVSDLEVIEELFAGGELKALRQTQEGRLIEAFIIIADKEIACASDYPPDVANYVTLLEKRYKAKLTEGQDKEHIEEVLSLVSQLQKEIIISSANRYQFTQTMRRLELFSGLLSDESPK